MRVPVRVNDRTLLLCVDTGSDSTCIAESPGRRAGLLEGRPGGRYRVHGAFGSEGRRGEETRLDLVEIGPVRLRNLPVLVQSGAYGDVDGLLGLEALRSLGAILDFGAGVLHFRISTNRAADPAAFLGPRSFRKVPLEPGFLCPIAHGDHWGRLMVDSGCSFSILSLETTRRWKLARYWSREEMRDVTGETRPLEGTRVLGFQVGDIGSASFDFAVVGLGKRSGNGPAPLDEPPVGVLGIDFLTLHRAVLDCAGGAVYLPVEQGRLLRQKESAR